MAIIKTINLTKKFKELVAVDNVNLEIEDRECFGLLGPNGAGKTSLIRMITGVSPPTQGEIWLNGKNLSKCLREAKSMIGVVPQLDNLDPDLTVLQNLLTFARYFDIPKKEAYKRSLDVLTFFELNAKQNNRINELSGGMKRRLLLARGLINQPKIMVMDEPSVGLDPQAKYLVWQRLRELKFQGVTLVLCTQNMEEATVLCDRVAIINLGKILAIGAPRELISRFIGDKTWEIDSKPGDRERVVKELEQMKVEYLETGTSIKVFHPDDKLTGKFEVTARPSTLEDVFFKLTGRSLQE